VAHQDHLVQLEHLVRVRVRVRVRFRVRVRVRARVRARVRLRARVRARVRVRVGVCQGDARGRVSTLARKAGTGCSPCCATTVCTASRIFS